MVWGSARTARIGLGFWALAGLAGGPLRSEDGAYLSRSLLIKTAEPSTWSLEILDIDPVAAATFPSLPKEGFTVGEGKRPNPLKDASGTIRLKPVGGKDLKLENKQFLLKNDVNYMMFLRQAGEGSGDGTLGNGLRFNHVFNLQSQKYGSFVFWAHQDAQKGPIVVECLGQAEWQPVVNERNKASLKNSYVIRWKDRRMELRDERDQPYAGPNEDAKAYPLNGTGIKVVCKVAPAKVEEAVKASAPPR